MPVQLLKARAVINRELNQSLLDELTPKELDHVAIGLTLLGQVFNTANPSPQGAGSQLSCPLSFWEREFKFCQPTRPVTE